MSGFHDLRRRISSKRAHADAITDVRKDEVQGLVDAAKRKWEPLLDYIAEARQELSDLPEDKVLLCFIETMNSGQSIYMTLSFRDKNDPYLPSNYLDFASRIDPVNFHMRLNNWNVKPSIEQYASEKFPNEEIFRPISGVVELKPDQPRHHEIFKELFVHWASENIAYNFHSDKIRPDHRSTFEV